MVPSPVRIAILEADTPIGKTLAKYGSYGGVFASLFYKAADATNVPRERFQITGWDVVDMERVKEKEEEGVVREWHIESRKGYPSLEDVDAVLITGSRFNAFDDDPWVLRLVDFVKRVLAQDRVKIIGVCYGHQIVGRALGAKVARSESGAWEVSVCQVAQTETGKELFGGKDYLSINQMHKDLVTSYPAAVQPLGSSPLCPVQGMYIPNRLLTVQGHPEFDEEIVRELLVRRKAQGVFDEAVYDEAVGRVGGRQDGVLVGGAFLRFLGVEEGGGW